MTGLLNKTWGLDHSPRNAQFFYALLMVGVVAGTIRLLILSAIVNGTAAGPFLIVVMLISGDRAEMGKYVNGKLAATLGWATTAIMLVAGAAGIWLTATGN